MSIEKAVVAGNLIPVTAVFIFLVLENNQDVFSDGGFWLYLFNIFC